MDYLKTYKALISKARTAKKEGYTEEHHIIPKSVYGQGLLDESGLSHVDDENNLVTLTAREHFVAHWLLHRVFPEDRNLALAFFGMAYLKTPDQKRDYIISSRTFAEAREAGTKAREKSILQYDLKGNYLREWESLNDAAEELGIVPSGIGNCLNDNAQSAGGYVWKYKTEDFAKKIQGYDPDTTAKPVGKYSLDGKLLEVFDSYLEAGEKTRFTEGQIRSAIRRRSKPRGCDFFFVGYERGEEVLKQVEPYKAKLHGFSIPVVQLTLDGEFIAEHPSATEAQKALGCVRSHIASVCKGKRSSTFGFKWMYKTDYENHRKD